MITAIYQVLTRLQRFLLRALGASTVGVRALVLDSEDRVLLVRHTYRPGWSLPGGGVKSGETVAEAIARELLEEVGVVVTGRLELFGVYSHVYMGVDDYPVVYVVRDYDLRQAGSPEIAEVRWFAPGDLPQDTTAGTRRRVRELFEGDPKAGWWA